jgi:uncharacterized membrane protein YeaQ/YmgE (transglycosylase-associated protein family)
MAIGAWIIFGLIAGLLAEWLMPGKAPGGIVFTILLGTAGGFVGGYLGSQILGIGDVTPFDLRSLALAVGGAVPLLLGYSIL